MPTLLEKNKELETILDSLKRAIWARRPILGDIMAKHGSKLLYDYTRDFFDVNKNPRLDQRKPELIEIAKELIEKRLGNKIAEAVAKQLNKMPLVSTTDHHGPIQHPFFLNSNIISAIPYYELEDTDINYLVVFSFASVSVNNASAYPRGIIFHGKKDGSGPLIRLPFLPDKLKMGVVYGTRAFTREDLTKAESELAKKEKSGEIETGRGEQIRTILEENFGTEQVLNTPDLNEQITEINFNLWQKLFHHADKNTNSERIPDLIYLEIETLVTELLLKKHLNNENSLIYKALFNPKYIELAHKYFNNVPGAFSTEKSWGTYMFWAMDEKKHRVMLKLENGFLISEDGKYKFEFTPEAVKNALVNKEIYPAMLLCYLMVSLYYGMKCLGGFCQVSDLTKTKEAWGKILQEMGETDEAEALNPVQTKELGGDGLVLSYLKTQNGDILPATGIDMVLEEDDTSYETYIELSKNVTLMEMMNPMLPEIYTVLYPIQEREEHLLSLSSEQISKDTGVAEKLV